MGSGGDACDWSQSADVSHRFPRAILTYTCALPSRFKAQGRHPTKHTGYCSPLSLGVERRAPRLCLLLVLTQSKTGLDTNLDGGREVIVSGE